MSFKKRNTNVVVNYRNQLGSQLQKLTISDDLVGQGSGSYWYQRSDFSLSPINSGSVMLYSGSFFGVNVMNPYYALDVFGDIGVSDDLIVSGSTKIVTNLTVSGSGYIVGDFSVGGNLTVTGSSNFINNVTITGTLNITSNVGIGETNPDTFLHVKGVDDNTNGQLKIESTENDARIELYNSDGAAATGRASILMSKHGTYTGLRFMINDTNTMIVDENSRVGIGDFSSPLSLFHVHGSDSSSTGPHVRYTTDSDDYPLFQQLNYSHDNVAFHFDCYWDGSFRSSDVGSNFQIYKWSDKLSFRYDSGISQGDVITWNDGISLDTVGTVSMPSMQHYISVGLTTSNTAQTGEFNPFNTTSYGGAAVTNASSGITYSSANGRFTIANAGTYEVEVVGYLSHSQSGSGSLTTYKLRKNDTADLWNAFPNVFDATNVEDFKGHIIVDLAASDYIEVKADSNSTYTLSFQIGSTMTIKRIA